MSGKGPWSLFLMKTRARFIHYLGLDNVVDECAFRRVRGLHW